MKCQWLGKVESPTFINTTLAAMAVFRSLWMVLWDTAMAPTFSTVHLAIFLTTLSSFLDLGMARTWHVPQKKII